MVENVKKRRKRASVCVKILSIINNDGNLCDYDGKFKKEKRRSILITAKYTVSGKDIRASTCM